MKLRTLLMIVGLGLLTGLFGLGIGSAHGQLHGRAMEQADRPEWVRTDGTIDLSRLPACFEVVNEKGQTVYKDDGEKLCIPSSQIYDSPTLLSGEELANQDVGARYEKDGSIIIEVPTHLWYHNQPSR